VTSGAFAFAPSVLEGWSAWVDLRGVGRNGRIPKVPGLYRIRRAGKPGLVYIGQTGRSLRGRLGQLNGVYGAEMPYRDPHTAAPALWALRHREGCGFEVSVVEIPGSVPQRKVLEATAITLYRIQSGRSPTANFGRMPAGYRISTGNNARLVAAGRRTRGGPDPATQAAAHSASVAGHPGGNPASADWMNWAWSAWVPIMEACRLATCMGLYRVRSKNQAVLVYVGQGNVALRLRTHRAKASRQGHRQGPYFAGDLAASWVALPDMPRLNLLEHENDLIAAHLLATGRAPTAQFLG
jgi:hypothetical protein